MPDFGGPAIIGLDALRYYAEHQPEINQTIQANRVPEALVHPAVQQRKLAA